MSPFSGTVATGQQATSAVTPPRVLGCLRDASDPWTEISTLKTQQGNVTTMEIT